MIAATDHLLSWLINQPAGFRPRA